MGIQSFKITISTLTPAGTPVSGVTVTVCYLGITNQPVLGTAISDPTGACTIGFEYGGRPDFIIKTLRNQTVFAPVLKKYNAAASTSLQIIEGGAALKIPSRFQRLNTKLNTALEGTGLQTLTADQRETLLGKTKQSPGELDLATQAQKMAQLYSLPEEAIYGLMKLQNSGSFTGIAVQPATVIERQLKQAVTKKWVDASTVANSAAFIDKLQQAGVKELQKSTATKDQWQQLLPLTSLTVAEKNTFFIQAVKQRGSGTLLWNSLEKDFQFTTLKTGELKTIFNLYKLSGNHLPLVSSLAAATKTAAQLTTLAHWDAKEWSDYLTTKNIAMPAGVSGNTAAEKKAAYASWLAGTFELAYPVQKATEKIRLVSTSADVKKFIAAMTDFDLNSTHINTYFKKNSTQIAQQAINSEAARKELNAWQRLYRITPATGKFPAMQALKNAGLDSAIRIVRGKTKKSFVKQFGTVLGNQAAAAMYNKAAGTAAKTISLAGSLATINKTPVKGSIQLPGTGTVPKPTGGTTIPVSTDAEINIPDLETLFGGQSYCECEHCRSVLSPAAYFVDLLEFLRNSDSNSAGKTPKDLLFERRPDMGQIQLSCENTNTALPYIDLVIEILENGVLLLNGKTTDYSYQTVGTTQELQAQPEHNSAEAYTIVQNAIYPLILPFSMWNAEADIYLDKMGAERFLLAYISQFTGNSTEPADLTVGSIHLGLSDNERKIISGVKQIGGVTYTAKDFWGETAAAWRTTLSNVDYFLDKTGLDYDELRQLLQVPYLNPTGGIKIQFSATGGPCDTSTATIVNADGTVAALDFYERLHRFLRLYKKTGWSIFDINKIIQSTGAADLTNAFLLQLSNAKWIKEKLGIKELADLLSWRSNLNTDVDVNDPESRSLYENLFLNKAVNNPVVSDFELNSAKTKLAIEDAGTAVSISSQASYIAGALRITLADLDLLMAQLGITTVTLTNLSVLYRYASAARAFKQDIDEILAAVNIISYNPFDATGNEGAVEFSKAMLELEQSGFTVKKLDYLLRHQFDLTDNIAPTDEAIGRFIEKLQEGVLKIQDENSFESDPAGDITRSMLAQLLSADDYITTTDILAETSALTKPEQVAFLKTALPFISPADIPANLLAVDNTITQEQRIQNRYNYLFEPVMAYLTALRSADYTAQVLAAEYGIDFDTAKLLLTELVISPADPAKLAVDELLDPLFINYEYDEAETISRSLFPAQYDVYLLMHKASLVVSTLNFSNEEIIWTYENAAAINWLNLNSLPLTAVTGPSNLFKSLRMMYRLAYVNEAVKTEDTSVMDILDKALFPNKYTPAITLTSLVSDLVTLTNWQQADMDFLTGTSGFNLKLQHFANGTALFVLYRYVQHVNNLGVSAQTIWGWTSTDLDEAKAAAIKQACKAKYSIEQWLSVAPPLRDRLRKLQRDALTGYLIAKGGYKDETALFDNYLIDVEMEPGMLTSRMKQACSSVQLFIQRGFMGLESGVELDDDQHDLWKWMKIYRVWEANRKVFLYPENWIEPELRTNQSEFFEALSNELLQNEINDDNVSTAFIHYLEKLDAVSNIQVVATYHQVEEAEDEDDAIDIFHAVGRTRSFPHVYYYRKRENEAWTAWEQVDADVEGDHILLCMHHRRLFLMWPMLREITKDAPGLISEFNLDSFVTDIALSNGYATADDYVNNELKAPFIRWEVKMCCSEYKQNKWKPKILTKTGIESEEGASLMLYLGQNTVQSPADFSFFPKISGDKIKVAVYQRVITMTDGEVVNDTLRYDLGDFSLNVLTGEFLAETDTTRYNWFLLLFGALVPETNKLIQAPDDSDQQYNDFVEDSGTHDLVLYTKDEAGDYNGKTVLGLTPGTFIIPMPVQYDEFVSEDSFFYQDDTRCFFVTPKDVLIFTQPGAPAGGPFTSFTGGLMSAAKAVDPGTNYTTRYKFETFYHPYSMELIKTTNRDGIEGFMNRDTQIQSEDYFDTTYDPQAVTGTYPVKNIDFDYGSAYGIYNWELFFHAPMVVAGHLSRNQQFEEAMKWYHFIFNPTDRTGDVNSTPQRYWQTKPFFEETTLASIYDLMYALSYTGTDSATLDLKEQTEAQIEAWKDDPFEPHTIAQLRVVAYMKAVVMKYIDNLIAWGDSLFRQDTIESINEATQLYILAYKILGNRPENIPQEETPDKTYNELLATGIDAFSNALVELEGYVSSSSSSSSSSTTNLLQYSLYFCIPHNDKLLGYWGTVEDRLFKIRNSMNIEGVKRSLALFEPPIDPAMLIKAKASGVDLGSILTDLNAPLPHYRFRFYIQKAMQFASEVQTLGTSLLSVLEKKDAEELALLRAGQELDLLKAIKEIKKYQLQEARENLEASVRAKTIAEERYNYYKSIEKIIQLESTNLKLLGDSDKKRKKAGAADVTASILSIIPNFGFGFASGLPPEISSDITFGGSNLASAANAVASVFRNESATLAHNANTTSINAGYERRWSDWKLQEKLAQKEIKQLDKQIGAAEIRVQLAEKELSNHELQTEQSKAAYEFLGDKFTSRELYQWLSSQLSTIYFQAYQLAYDCAKRAQKNFQYELASDQTYIQFGYWDSLKKGLLAGERLLHDLRRMEAAYYDQHKRQYEITKNISLLQLDPLALLMLRQNGECYIEIPEALFDLDLPGQYMRRIKSVNLTIPCLAGPYTGLHATVTLLENSYRKDPLATSGYAEVEADTRFVYNQAAIQSIATSNGKNDSGMFQLNFEDDRYLPFEGAGAISRWRIQLPAVFRPFDYNSISDVIIQLNYTAKDGGETLRTTVQTQLQTAIVNMALGSGNTGLTRIFSARQEQSGDWYRFMNPPVSQTDQSMVFDNNTDKFPYLFRDYTITVSRVEIALAVDVSVLTGSTSLKIQLTRPSGTAASVTLAETDTLTGVLYGSVTGVSEEPGNWTVQITETDIPAELRTEADGHKRLNTALVTDMLMICSYGIS